MSAGEAVYGKIVYDTVDVVIRVKEENGEVIVKVHQKVAGREMLPTGYMIGSNYIIWRKL